VPTKIHLTHFTDLKPFHMILKDFSRLSIAIDNAVHTDGPLGKTTALGVNALLKNLTSELLTDVQPIAHSELLTQLSSGMLHPGQRYLVTDRPTTTLGSSGEVLVQAIAADALATEALLCAYVPDYQVPRWQTNYFAPGPVQGVSYEQTTTPYVALTPTFIDPVDRTKTGDDTPYIVQLPFPFTFGGITYTECEIDTNARLVFGSANYASVYTPSPLGSSEAPIIAFAWADMVMTSAIFNSFVLGQAPYRKFVFDYKNAHTLANFGGGLNYDTTDTFTGQLVLEESTNAITMGFQSYSVLDTGVVQGLQYAGKSFELNPKQALAAGTLTRFTPIIDRAAAVEVLVPVNNRVVWNGQTWALVGRAADEPGTSASWVPAIGAHRDQHGNSVRMYDAIRYRVLQDEITQRCDAANNSVTGSSIANFPWGKPGLRDNVLRGGTLDNSLLNTPELNWEGNTLVDVVLTNVNLKGIAFHNNQLFGISLNRYTPLLFDNVTAYYGFNQDYTSCSHQVFVNGREVQESVSRSQMQETLLGFKQKFIGNQFTTYLTGQPVSYIPLDLLTTKNTDYTAHDLIEINGYYPTDVLCLRNQDYRINGNATFARPYLGHLTKGLNLAITGLTFLGETSMVCANYGPTGHTISLTRCTLNTINCGGGSGNGQPNRYTFMQCTIGRLSNINSEYNQQAIFDNCTFVGLSAGSVFGGGRAAGNGPLVIANSTIILKGTATLFDPGFDMTYAPSFHNVTVIAADGTASKLG
jgi:hypothetical protein